MIDANRIIGDWIEPQSRILDLGCGDGTLLYDLTLRHKIHGYGLEIDPASINQCIANGINVIPVSYTHLTLPTIYSV